MENIDKIIATSQVVVHAGRFAYLKAKEMTGKFFMVAHDEDEITIVVEEKDLTQDYVESVKWFSLIEIKVSMPFIAKGFLAKVTDAIAKAGLNILAISTFSKDYILVREESKDDAIRALKDIGFPIEAL